MYLGILASSLILQEHIKLRYPHSSSPWQRERLKEQKTIHTAVTAAIPVLYWKSINHLSIFQELSKRFQRLTFKTRGLSPSILYQGSKCVFTEDTCQ